MLAILKAETLTSPTALLLVIGDVYYYLALLSPLSS